MSGTDLVVFVTELARRQFIRREVLARGFVDASRFTTMSRLRADLVRAARGAGLLRGREPGPAEQLILHRRAARLARSRMPAGGALSSLTARALADTLGELLGSLDSFAGRAEAIHHWLLEAAPETGKLRQLGVLYSAYRELSAAAGVADTRDTNTAVLNLLAGSRDPWPASLAGLRGRLIFRAVRWLNPFEDQMIAALKRGLGPDRVCVLSALPPAHAERMEDRLAAQVRSEVMMGADEIWQPWTESLGDAMATDDANLAMDSRDRMSFFHSAGPYGEVEDAARRIAWEIRHRGVPPDRIALVVRNLGDYADAVAHVFTRFGIPCFLRRGLPVSAAPLAKTGLALLSWPLNAERDRLADLLKSPAIQVAGLEDESDRAEAAFDLLACGCPPRVSSDALERRLEHHYRAGAAAPQTARRRRSAILQFADRLRALAAPAPLRDHARGALKALDHFQLGRAGDDASIPLQTRSVNLRALDAIRAAIGGIADAAADPQPCAYADFVDLLTESIEEETVTPGGTTESGVWVLNAYDTAGLKFDVVLVAGLNEGAFPAIPRQDSLLSDAERTAAREALQRRGIEIPSLALPLSTTRATQESILFLVALGAAQKQLVLSYPSVSADGRELVPGAFFRSVWTLAGFPARDRVEPDAYDAWRIANLPPGSGLPRHLERQQALPPYRRAACPGESYLATIPLPLCCAADEARQRVAYATEEPALGAEIDRELNAAVAAAPSPTPVARGAHNGITVERARERFFTASSGERPADAPYCGRLATPETRRRAAEWLASRQALSATALEKLARCRYRFLLSNVAGLEELRTQEDEPDPMDRGTLVHEILHIAYSALTGRTAPLHALDPDLAREFSALCRPAAWAHETAPGRWRLADRPPKSGRALPLAGFAAAEAPAYTRFAHAVAETRLAQAERAQENARLGDPGVWATEKPKLLQIVSNYLLFDAAHAAAERRYPAVFELAFGWPRETCGEEPALPQLVLAAGPAPLPLRGKVDRVDLVFDESGALSGVVVMDYKAPSRGGLSAAAYAEEIAANLDCQLPVYGFAAQQFLFGRHNEPALNDLTRVVYHIQDRNPAEMAKQFAKRAVPLNHVLDNDAALTGAFLGRLSENVERLRSADFAVDPLDCEHCEFAHICRVDVNALAAQAAENGP